MRDYVEIARGITLRINDLKWQELEALIIDELQYAFEDGVFFAAEKIKTHEEGTAQGGCDHTYNEAGICKLCSDDLYVEVASPV